jgi:hypothetical protein
MKVAKDLVVSLAYQVRTEDGVLVDESPVSAPLDYLHGHGSLISGLETALEGHELATNLMSLLARTTLTVSTTKTWCNVFLKTYLWALMNCR